MIAGPNGSGKSSITASPHFDAKRNLIDPDAIAKAMNKTDPAQAALAAGRLAILLARQFVEQRESFAVETTLAGNGQLQLLGEAKRAGFDLPCTSSRSTARM
jgi:predicted ABC-type ATPase